jgi:hypothetical protein
MEGGRGLTEIFIAPIRIFVACRKKVHEKADKVWIPINKCDGCEYLIKKNMYEFRVYCKYIIKEESED